MKQTLKTLRKITTTTRGKSRKDIILAVSAWEIQAREELQQQHGTYTCPRCHTEIIDGAVISKKEILGVEYSTPKKEGETPRTLQQAHERLENWKKKGENQT